MTNGSPSKKLLIRLTSDQQADLKAALNVDKPCEYLEIPFGQSELEKRLASMGPVNFYGVIPPDSMGPAAVKILESW